MAKFKYGMQNILDLKVKLEDQQRMALAAARINLNSEEDKLETLYTRKIGAAAFESMDYFIGLQKVEVKKAEGKLKIEQDKMVEAMKERKIQEKLREKAFDRFLKEIADEESKMVDELVAYKYNSNRNEEEQE